MVDFRIPKTPVWVVTLCSQTQRNIVFSGWQIESSFCIVVENIETGLSEIGVLSSVVNSMIVIPQGASILSVGIVVVLVLTRFGDIISPVLRVYVSKGHGEYA